MPAVQRVPLVAMKRMMSVFVSLSLLIAGCASSSSQRRLETSQQACGAGNQKACNAAYYQGQAVEQEQQQNTEAALGAAALLGLAAVIGVIASSSNDQPSRNDRRHRRYR